MKHNPVIFTFENNFFTTNRQVHFTKARKIQFASQVQKNVETSSILSNTESIINSFSWRNMDGMNAIKTITFHQILLLLLKLS